MKRREFIILLGGAAAAWPLAAQAQQAEQMRRVGVLIAASEDDPDMRSRLAGFRQGLERLGWADGRNLRVDYVFAGGQPERFRPLARELIARKPDVLFAQTPTAVAAMQRETREIPIVFADVSDPVGPGFIASLAATRWQSHRRHIVRGEHHRQMAGDAQGDRARPRARRFAGQSQDKLVRLLQAGRRSDGALTRDRAGAQSGGDRRRYRGISQAGRLADWCFRRTARPFCTATSSLRLPPRAPAPAICRSSGRRSSSWWSTSRPRSRWD
jgi:ABC transporter substrate binding protein